MKVKLMQSIRAKKVAVKMFDDTNHLVATIYDYEVAFYIQQCMEKFQRVTKSGITPEAMAKIKAQL